MNKGGSQKSIYLFPNPQIETGEISEKGHIISQLFLRIKDDFATNQERCVHGPVADARRILPTCVHSYVRLYYTYVGGHGGPAAMHETAYVRASGGGGGTYGKAAGACMETSCTFC